jgi:REP element-mobilizing transposase RayT
LRGNGRQAIFFDADDRRRWESFIEEGVSRYAHRIHAYCWMTNHVHLAIQCHDIPLAKLMGFVASQYARPTTLSYSSITPGNLTEDTLLL